MSAFEFETAEPSAALAPESIAATPGVVIGALIGFKDEGQTPLVMFRGQPGAATCAARATVAVHGGLIGRQVVLVFENGDARLPIIMGVLQQTEAWPLPSRPESVEVEADGERLILSAKRQLALRCGKASITLTCEGKVLIEGTYVSNRSSGVLRVKGGSVQIN